jgi:Pyridoxamine 5'-phosphate oxidase
MAIATLLPTWFAPSALSGWCERRRRLALATGFGSQTVWNKSNRCAGERGGARVARSAASRMLRTMREGIPVCVTVTLLDGLVLARSAFHHSMNYRSVMILGTAVEVTDQTEKYEALKADGRGRGSPALGRCAVAD